MQELTLNLARTRGVGYHPDQLPFIVFRRVLNPGLGKDHGEEVVEEKQVLFDTKGGPFVGLGPEWLDYCLRKGFEVVSYGNFDAIRQANGQPFEQLEAIRPAVESAARTSAAIRAQQAEIEKLRAEKAQLEAEVAAKANAAAEPAPASAGAGSAPAAEGASAPAEGAKEGKSKAK